MLKKMIGRVCVAAAVLYASTGLPTAAQAESYPVRPITLVIGYPPGGSTDLAGRILAEEMSNALKTAVIVENQGGAGGALAAQRVARAPSDGYRLMRWSGLLPEQQLPSAWCLAQPPACWALQVTHAVVAESMDFSFEPGPADLACVPRSGTVVAHQGGKPIVTPYDDCVLVMPSLRQLRPGVTVVRLARRIALGALA